MELHLKINDVVGMDDQKRHIIRVDDESLRDALFAHPGWITQCVVKDFLLKHNTRLLNEIIDDPTLRNNIYMDEKAKREQKAERRERHRQDEIAKQRRRDQFIASKNYRQSVDYIHNVLGWNNEEGIQKASFSKYGKYYEDYIAGNNTDTKERLKYA